jgi:hypothetical protein
MPRTLIVILIYGLTNLEITLSGWDRSEEVMRFL